jgi:hypothetical protein
MSIATSSSNQDVQPLHQAIVGGKRGCDWDGSEDHSLDEEEKEPEVRDSHNNNRFNAAEHFYLSHRVAKEFPEISTSPIVLSYRTPWPRQSYHRVHDIAGEYGDFKVAITRSVSLVAVFFLSNLLAVPAAIQDMVLEIVSAVTIGYTMLLHVRLYQIYPVLVIIPTLFMLMILHFILKAWNKQSELRQINLTKQIKDKVSKTLGEKPTFLPKTLDAVDRMVITVVKP